MRLVNGLLGYSWCDFAVLHRIILTCRGRELTQQMLSGGRIVVFWVSADSEASM